MINLSEWPTELRETFYLLDHQSVIKGCNLGTAKQEICRGGYGEGMQGSQALSGHVIAQHCDAFTRLEAL